MAGNLPPGGRFNGKDPLNRDTTGREPLIYGLGRDANLSGERRLGPGYLNRALDSIHSLKCSFTSELKSSLVSAALQYGQNQVMLEQDTSELAIAARLTEAMNAARVTNTALAEACDVTVQAVGDWKRTGKIARDQLPTICATIKRSSDWLVTGKPTIEDLTAPMADDIRQEVFDFVLFKINQAPNPYADPKHARGYTDMIEKITRDMRGRKG